jgi:hypothetical protein
MQQQYSQDRDAAEHVQFGHEGAEQFLFWCGGGLVVFRIGGHEDGSLETNGRHKVKFSSSFFCGQRMMVDCPKKGTSFREASTEKENCSQYLHSHSSPFAPLSPRGVSLFIPVSLAAFPGGERRLPLMLYFRFPFASKMIDDEGQR